MTTRTQPIHRAGTPLTATARPPTTPKTHMRAAAGRTKVLLSRLSVDAYLGLYCEFYRAAEVNYQLAITVPTAGGGLIGVALNRHGHDFGAEDLDVLDQHPHGPGPPAARLPRARRDLPHRSPRPPPDTPAPGRSPLNGA